MQLINSNKKVSDRIMSISKADIKPENTIHSRGSTLIPHSTNLEEVKCNAFIMATKLPLL